MFVQTICSNLLMTINKEFEEIATTITNVIKNYSLNSQNQVDEKFKLQLATSIFLLTHIYVLLSSIANHPNQDQISNETFESQIIIWQSCNTMLAALQLVRQGYPLEPQFLARSAIESLALALSFHLDDGAFAKYNKGKLLGNECIGSAKKVVKEIGQIYGLLSEVTHPSRKTTGNNYNPHSSSIIIGGGYTEKLSHRTLFNFSLLNYLLLTIWKGSEFIFYEFEEKPKFWTRKEDRYSLKLHDSIKKMSEDIKKDFETAIASIGSEDIESV